MLQKTPLALQADIKGISHVVIDVPDLDAAKAFYVDILGFAMVPGAEWPSRGGQRTAVLRAGLAQLVVLADGPHRNDPGISAAHTAYALSTGAREKLIERVAAAGVTIRRYREDRPSEVSDNVYLEDPAGNRIQLVARDGAAALAIDHVAVETNNILWSREFYGTWLGMPVEHRVGWKTSDYLDAKALGEAGMTAAMPGSRYWNERYSEFEKERKAIRPNAQIYLPLGGGTSVAVYLASRKYQAPRDDVNVGTPCLGLATTPVGLARIIAFFRDQGRDVDGPVAHGTGSPLAASAYLKDPGGNFLEFCVPR
jgi:catechol 2,3-dioxygenase-like lactoylglutathione lyase family enzyme